MARATRYIWGCSDVCGPGENPGRYVRFSGTDTYSTWNRGSVQPSSTFVGTTAVVGAIALLGSGVAAAAPVEWQDCTDFKGLVVPLEIISRMRRIDGKSVEEWQGRGTQVGEAAWKVLTDWAEKQPGSVTVSC